MGVITVFHSQGAGQPIIIERRDAMRKSPLEGLIGCTACLQQGKRIALVARGKKMVCPACKKEY